MKCFSLVFFAFSALVLDFAVCKDIGVTTILGITSCRASCLDKFSESTRSENSCENNRDCLMCWEVCDMLYVNNMLWEPMCSVPEICLPGCQSACVSHSSEIILNETLVSSLAVKSVYDVNTDRVILEWEPEEQPEENGVVLYSILLKDSSHDWQRITETTSHIFHVHGKTVTRDSSFGIIAANATDLVAYAEVPFVTSLMHGSKSPMEIHEHAWAPHLVSLERSKSTNTLLATVAWSQISNEDASTEYEISWTVIDDALEVTGHLRTSQNESILTLWPDSIYLIQVTKCPSSGTGTGISSAPLVIDTKLIDNYPLMSDSFPTISCAGEFARDKIMAYFWISLMFIASFGILLVIARIKYSMLLAQIAKLEKNQYELENEDEKDVQFWMEDELVRKVSDVQRTVSTADSSNIMYHVV